MTLTRDRTTELLRPTPPVRRRRRGRPGPHRRPDPSRSTFPPTTSSPARARSGPGSSSSPSGRVRVVRDGETLADARSGRLLRGAVGPRRQAAERPGRRRTEPTICLALASWDFEAVVARAAERRAGHPARAGRSAARPDRSRTGTEPPTARPSDDRQPARRPRHRHVPVHRHRGLHAASSIELGTGPLRATSASATATLLRDGLRGPRRRRAGHRGRLVLRRLREAPPRPSPPPSTRSARSPPSPGRTDAPIRVRMGLHSGEAESAGGTSGRARHQPRGPDRRGRPRRPDPRVATRPAPSSTATCPTASACATSASIGSRTWRAPGAARPARRRRPAGRVPAAPLARRPAQQPADPADDVRRPRARARRGRRRCWRGPGC